ALASLLSVTAHLGVFGGLAQAFSALIALGTAFVTAPLIAWATKGRYYIARQSDVPAREAVSEGTYKRYQVQRCIICEREYEGPDMAHCPAYQGPICSLCCTLDARCGDLCKPHASLSSQWSATLRWLLPRRSWPYLDNGLGYFLLLMLVIVPLLASVFGLLYHQELRALAQSVYDIGLSQAPHAALRSGFLKAYMALLLLAGLVAWWVVLAHKSRQVAQEESNRQTHLLMLEIESHRQTDEALQTARRVAEQARHAADQANQAKSRYISAISHELRTPLNSILGYAQLMGEDASIPAHRQQAVSVIKRGGEHLLSLIEGTLDIAHIESGKLTLNVKPMHFALFVQEIASLFELEAQAKGLRFHFEAEGALPAVVRADEKRVRQILINLLGNAIKFTARGQVTFRLRYAREMAVIDIEDTGPGLSAQEHERIFEPFTRANTPGATAPGAGLGLTIAKMLTDLMGGELTVTSTPGVGSLFKVKLFLPEVRVTAGAVGALSLSGSPADMPRPLASKPRHGYAGPRRRVLVVDNEEADRELLVNLLQPLGFELRTAASGHDCLDLLAAGYQPDVIFMDLAMPGIDGWETIRRLRALAQGSALAQARIAIVSANAFDKGLDNDVGMPGEDFILKPVRHSELLDWLALRLNLTWLEAPAPLPHPASVRADAPQSGAMIYPGRPQLDALREVVSLGYYRGIMNKLDEIEASEAPCAAFVSDMRALARQFQFEAMSRQLNPVVIPDSIRDPWIAGQARNDNFGRPQ
ncbi:MAG: ATP-binding protein, partial [Rhodoferax sp.]|nr:ATP-binding protein [Rhodoferax sp.]